MKTKIVINSRSAARQGFTLIELLVVIAIIDGPSSFLCKRPAEPAAACILPLKLHAAAAISAQGGAPNPKRGKSGDTNNK